MNLYAQDKNGVYYYSTFSDSMVKLLNFTLKDSEFRVLRNKNNAQYFVTPYKVFLNGKEVMYFEGGSTNCSCACTL